jgi:hypothetical protein
MTTVCRHRQRPLRSRSVGILNFDTMCLSNVAETQERISRVQGLSFFTTRSLSGTDKDTTMLRPDFGVGTNEDQDRPKPDTGLLSHYLVPPSLCGLLTVAQ